MRPLIVIIGCGLLIACGGSTGIDRRTEQKQNQEKIAAISPLRVSEQGVTADWVDATLPIPFESSHPYENFANAHTTIRHPGASRMRIHFSQFNTEDFYDFVYLYDQQGEEMARYHGNLGAFDSAVIEGEEVTIRFVTDINKVRDGFRVDRYRYQVDDPTPVYAWRRFDITLSSHRDKKGLYADDLTGDVSADPARNSLWTIEHPGATAIRVIFSRIETEVGFDFLYLGRSADQLELQYDGSRSRFETPSIQGSRVVVRLTSDENVAYAGFTVEGYEAYVRVGASICGNDQLEDGEDCDGRELGGKSCDDFPEFTGGTLTCSNSCEFDKSGCTSEPPGTAVGGIISQDTRWTAPGSPYRITREVQLASGATLTVDPGVHVVGAAARSSDRVIRVFDGATLSARGTGVDEGQQIHFSNVNLFGNEGQSVIHIEFAAFDDHAAIAAAEGGSLIVRQSAFEETEQIVLFNPRESIIERNAFRDSLGIVVHAAEEPIWILSNSFIGQKTTGGAPAWDYAVLAESAGSFDSTRIPYVVLCDDQAIDTNLIVAFNSFLSTDRVALRLDTAYSNPRMTARCNFFATTEPRVIDLMVYDNQDDLLARNEIVYQPFLERCHHATSGCDTPPPQGTNVSGIISQDTTWRRDGSPYLLQRDVEIARSATLTIHPGVVVKRPDENGDPRFIRTWGTVRAMGHRLNRIIFDRVWTATEEDENASPRIEIQGAEFDRAAVSTTTHNGTLILRDSIIRNNGWHPIDLRGPKGSCFIERNQFIASRGIQALEGAAATISIINNRFEGLLADSAFDGAVTGEGQTESSLIVRHNSFLDTDRTAINAAYSQMTATENYWNTTDRSIIDGMVLDRHDSLSYREELIYEPVLTTCHPATPGCSEASAPLCGNGLIEDREDCDGSALRGKSCVDFEGFSSGTLTCTSSCAFDTSGCSVPPIGTEVAGSIDQDTTWTLAGSPYRLVGDVGVSFNNRLEIQPGVIVEGAGKDLVVHGMLQAIGTGRDDGARVVFSNLNIVPGEASFQQPRHDIALQFVEIDGGSFYSPTSNAVYGKFSLRDSYIHDTTQWSYSYVWYPTGDCFVERNQFLRTGGFSVGVSTDGRMVIRNNSFAEQQGSFAILSWSRVGNQYLTVENNSFLSTDRAALWLEYNDSTMNGANNYWNTTDLNQIKGLMVHDRDDDLQILNHIPIEPILTTCHPATPGC